MLGPIAAACPVCGSDDVIYSCAPHCCFNHVCGACRASWQHRTAASEFVLTQPEPAPDSEYDTAYPAAPCLGCSGLVFQVAGTTQLWCPVCSRHLRLECTEVQPYSG